MIMGYQSNKSEMQKSTHPIFLSIYSMSYMFCIYKKKKKKKLLFVHEFTKSTNTYFEFHSFNFFVKDRATRKILFHVLSNHGLYSIPPSSVINKPHIPAKMAMAGERTSLSSWHSRLGHPAFQVVWRLPSSF